MTFHFADVWEAIADRIPSHPAVIQGTRQISWGEYDERSARLSRALTGAGLGPGSTVGMFLYNCPEYLETQFAAFKARITPINVNYRYLDDELVYLLDNADCEAVVFHSSLGDRIERVRTRLPKLRVLIEVADDTSAAVSGALAYDEVLASNEPAARQERSPDDLYMLYTGGTTGMPKGVMYSMGRFTEAYVGYAAMNLGVEVWPTVDALAAHVEREVTENRQGRTTPCPPLMHGTGIWLGAMLPHILGNTCVLLESRSLDPDEIWKVVEEGVSVLIIVGDAFARPMLDALRARPRDTSKLAVILSSGAMLSAEVKEGLVELIPHVIILDVLGSSEGAMAQNVTVGKGSGTTAKFGLMADAKVFTEDGRPVEPGSGEVGMVGVTGVNIPLGYWKDPEKSAATFREIDGVPYSFPGDMATVEADGTVTLLGRGSACINTGGEKVFPEEVEEAVKTHPAVRDCLVFGIPDERFGQRVVAVASLVSDASANPDELIAHTRDRLAPFKAPRDVVIVDDAPRAPNGKADYGRARDLFTAASSST
jgi:fatty-acyl-CoA synthase